MKNAKKFFEKDIKTEEAKALLASVEAPKTEEDRIAAFIDIAKKLGIELTAEEIKEYYASSRVSDAQEIDDKELEQLSGGAANGCYASYVDRENCWVNDGCDYINNYYSSYNCSWSVKGICAMLWEDKDKKEPVNTSFDLSVNVKPTKFG